MLAQLKGLLCIELGSYSITQLLLVHRAARIVRASFYLVCISHPGTPPPNNWSPPDGPCASTSAGFRVMLLSLASSAMLSALRLLPSDSAAGEELPAVGQHKGDGALCCS